MLKAVIKEAKLKLVVEAVLSMVEEAKFTFSDKGLEIKSVDPANVAMVKVLADASAFEFFKSTNGAIGVDLKRLQEALSSAEKDEPVTLQMNEESQKLAVSMGRIQYELSLIDTSAIRAEPKIPELSLPIMVELSGVELKKSMKACSKVSDHVKIGMTNEIFVIAGKGDIDKVELKMLTTEMQAVRIGECSSLFSLDYMEDIAKVAGKMEKVRLEVGQDYPMRVQFMTEGILVEYLLAPRIEQD